MGKELNETDMRGQLRSDEELDLALNAVRLNMGKVVEFAKIAPGLAINLMAIHDFLLELQWMRGKLEEARQRRKASVVGGCR